MGTPQGDQGWELRIDLVGSSEAANPVLSALDDALGPYSSFSQATTPPETSFRPRWRFAAKSDAMHAAEIAEKMLEGGRARLEWRLWLRSDSDPEEHLLAQSPN